MTAPGIPAKQGLYDPQYEHDACGVGFVVDLKGRATHDLLQQGIQILLNLEHRGACGCKCRTPSSGRNAPSSGSSCPGRANMRWAWCSCQRIPATAAAASSCSR